jgi:DNA polymerase I
MNSSPWLLLDVSFLAYRAYFAIGKLSHGQIATTVVYGVLREVLRLQETFATTKVAFCFDVGKPLRHKLLPTYKGKRESQSDEDQQAKLEVRDQIQHLRKDYLPQIGYRNILAQKGYEADDVIAQIVWQYPEREFVIVSGDRDLYQLLSCNVSIWKSKQQEYYTEESFWSEFGISPKDWIDVKALAGCSSDNVPGITGVGEKTAAKYLRGELKGKTLQKIEDNQSLITINRKLVGLPYPGMDLLRLKKDTVTAKGWSELIGRLGMNSLAGAIPGIPRMVAKPLTKATLGRF